MEGHPDGKLTKKEFKDLIEKVTVEPEVMNHDGSAGSTGPEDRKDGGAHVPEL